MSRGATVLGCALALTVGIQVAEASSCIDHQLVDKLGQIVRDANGHPVPCGLIQTPEIRNCSPAIKGFIWRWSVAHRWWHRGGAGDELL